MKTGGFGCAGDIFRGNTLLRWSTPVVSAFDNDPLALLLRSRSGFPGSIERGKSSPDQVDQSLTVSSRSVTVRGYSFPICYRSRYYAETPAYVSFCNSKNGFPPLRVTDRDVIGRPLAMSQSVTIRRVFSPIVLQIETNLKPGGSQTR